MGAIQIELEKLTKVYLKIKDRRNELSRQFKDEDGELKEQQETIKRALLDHCKEHNVESVGHGKDFFIGASEHVIGHPIGKVCTGLYMKMVYRNSLKND
jgi:hypothetical protein